MRESINPNSTIIQIFEGEAYKNRNKTHLLRMVSGKTLGKLGRVFQIMRYYFQKNYESCNESFKLNFKI